MNKLIIASGNANKISEITSILRFIPEFKYQLEPIPQVEEPDEPFDTFIENAIHKARYYGKISNLTTLSEDTGLSIKALHQFPGVHTKKFIRDQGGMEAGILKFEELLRNYEDYSASMTCVAAIYLPENDTVLYYEAVELGTLTFPPKGIDGFGFDPIFIPNQTNKTIAELGQQFKNQNCHRALAIKGLFNKLLSKD